MTSHSPLSVKPSFSFSMARPSSSENTGSRSCCFGVTINTFHKLYKKLNYLITYLSLVVRIYLVAISKVGLKEGKHKLYQTNLGTYSTICNNRL